MDGDRTFLTRALAVGLLAGLALVLWAAQGSASWQARGGASPESVITQRSDDDRDEDSEDLDDEPDSDGEVNLVALHNRRSSRFHDEGCRECHADIHSRESLDPTLPTAHRVMLPFSPGKARSDRQCLFCHPTVDLVQGTQRVEDSAGNLRRHVDVAICTLCHAPRPGASARQLYQATLLSPTDPDGPRLYRLLCSGCHGDLADSEVNGESASEIWDAIEEDEGGMAPLAVLTANEIRAIAAVLADSDSD